MRRRRKPTCKRRSDLPIPSEHRLLGGGALAWAIGISLLPEHRGRQAQAVLALRLARELEREGVERVVRVGLGVDLDRFHPVRRAAAPSQSSESLPAAPKCVRAHDNIGSPEPP